MKTKTKMKTKVDFHFCFQFVFHFCFCFCFCFLKILVLVNSTWRRGAIDAQLSLDWPRSAIAPRNMASLVQKIKITTLS